MSLASFLEYKVKLSVHPQAGRELERGQPVSSAVSCWRESLLWPTRCTEPASAGASQKPQRVAAQAGLTPGGAPRGGQSSFRQHQLL